jgi:hypothetical protein
MHSEEWNNIEDRLNLVGTEQLDNFIEELSPCFIASVLQIGQSNLCGTVGPTNLHSSSDEGKLWLNEAVVFLNGCELEERYGSAQAQLGSYSRAMVSKTIRCELVQIQSCS